MMKWLACRVAGRFVRGARRRPRRRRCSPATRRSGITIQGPVGSIARKAAKSIEPQRGDAEPCRRRRKPIRSGCRRAALSRRTGGICDFPPLRVEFAQPPAATSLFAGQRRLKLVTHCRSSAGFQQHLLLEYSAYRMFNQLTPLSFRVRLATVDYAEPSGKVSTTPLGLLHRGSGRCRQAQRRLARRGSATASSPPSSSRAQAARVALFEYMIGNLDWSMRAGPAGRGLLPQQPADRAARRRR